MTNVLITPIRVLITPKTSVHEEFFRDMLVRGCVQTSVTGPTTSVTRAHFPSPACMRASFTQSQRGVGQLARAVFPSPDQHFPSPDQQLPSPDQHFPSGINAPCNTVSSLFLRAQDGELTPLRAQADQHFLVMNDKKKTHSLFTLSSTDVTDFTKVYTVTPSAFV